VAEKRKGGRSDMGCDIHLYVEKRVNGAWESADKWSPNEYYSEEGGNKEQVKYEDAFYNNRNYKLFSVLADVRNGYGFAGIPTGEVITPICSPKELPKDCTDKVKLESEIWGCDGHSHSWLTVAELDSYDWDKGIIIYGCLTQSQYAALKNGEKPNSWSGAISGPNVLLMSVTDYENLSEEEKNHPEKLFPRFRTNPFHDPNPNWPIEIYISAQWDTSLRDQCLDFLNQTMPKLRELGSPEDVRIVFWFDN
jgi:hypothetical protein